MNRLVEQSINETVDGMQQRLTDYACGIDYNNLTPEAIHAAKVRVIDTLGALIGGFFGEPCRIARNMAARMPDPAGATVIGTRMKTSPDMAAFVNATTARYVELNDVYHWPDSIESHPSDMLPPLLGLAEHLHASGRDFITSSVLAYEVSLRIGDVFPNRDFDYTTFQCLGTAAGAGKLLGLSARELSHCIAMAIVPNNVLRQVRTSHLSMWKVLAAGHTGRAGIFAAMLAREGVDGPHLPFEGKAGWCDHVARKKLSLDVMGGNGTPFRIQDTLIKQRSSCATTISSILAAEKVAPALKNINDVKQVTVEVYQFAKERMGTGEHHWNPSSRETADHSIPYVTAAALVYGTVTPREFNDAHLWNPELRALLKKIEVVTNDEFTEIYERPSVLPVHPTRVTVITNSGERIVGESGGDKGDLSEHKSDAQIAEKFRGLTEEFLGVKRVNAILDRLWNLDQLENVAVIPPDFVLD